MMIGIMTADAKGFLIETTYAMSSEPILLVSRHRVNVMNGRPQSESENVRFDGSIWSGYDFQCNTEQYPEATEQLPIRKPRGAKVYRDGEWRKR
jgi:hypothetical protein